MSWFFGKKKGSKTKLKTQTPAASKEKLLRMEQSNFFYSVVITRCGCKASSKLISEHFLFEDAPFLPLSGCSAEKCTCEYQGLVNRRRHERRLTVRRANIRMSHERRLTGRRHDEKCWNNYSM